MLGSTLDAIAHHTYQVLTRAAADQDQALQQCGQQAFQQACHCLHLRFSIH